MKAMELLKIGAIAGITTLLGMGQTGGGCQPQPTSESDYGAGSDTDAADDPYETIDEDGGRRTPTGFYYPVDPERYDVDDNNWLACGPRYVDGKRHLGSDIPCPVGTEVRAVGRGTIRDVQGDGEGNSALIIKPHDQGGCFLGVYGHISPVKTKGTVAAGELIGFVAQHPQGSHLHFGVRTECSLDWYPAGWGRVSDSTCRSTATYGFTAPISWLRSQTPD